MADIRPTNNDARTAESLIRDLERLRDAACAGCGAPVGPHQSLMAIAIGFKDPPRCLRCLGAALDQEPARLRDWLFDYVRQRECFLEAWNWANREAGLAEGVLPLSLQAIGPVAELPNSPCLESALEPETANPSPLHADAEWDAGDMACGDLVLELRLRLRAMRPGQIMKLCARDPGAPQDLPAWCRLTWHTLLRAEHPTYWIQRKE